MVVSLLYPGERPSRQFQEKPHLYAWTRGHVQLVCGCHLGPRVSGNLPIKEFISFVKLISYKNRAGWFFFLKQLCI